VIETLVRCNLSKRGQIATTARRESLPSFRREPSCVNRAGVVPGSPMVRPIGLSRMPKLAVAGCVRSTKFLNARLQPGVAGIGANPVGELAHGLSCALEKQAALPRAFGEARPRSEAQGLSPRLATRSLPSGNSASSRELICRTATHKLPRCKPRSSLNATGCRIN
jgi:hypothetical protein